MEQTRTTPTLLLDIMLGDVYKGQLKYYGHGNPELINGKIVEVWDPKILTAFVEEQRPSLKGKDFQVHFSNQKI